MSLREAPAAAQRMLAVEASTYGEPNVAAARNNTCPCCGTVGEFYEGPSGGMSTNYECARCGSKINVSFGFGGPFRCDILLDTDKAKEMRAAAFKAEQERVAADHARRVADAAQFWRIARWFIGGVLLAVSVGATLLWVYR